MKKVAALLGITLLLAACGQQSAPTAGGTTSVGALNIVVGGGQVTVTPNLISKRLTSTQYTDETRWTLTKKATGPEGDATANFEVKVDKTVERKLVAKSVSTVVSSNNALKICNTGTASVTVQTVSVTLTGLTAPATALSPTIPLSLFTTPFDLAPGACKDATNFSLSSASADLSADQKAMLNAADFFRMSYVVTSTASGVNSSVDSTPELSAISNIGISGDQSVILTDPLFGYTSGPITDDTTVPFGRSFTCADKTGLRADTANDTLYYLDNTAFLKGDTTNLKAEASAPVTLRCAIGCTYTQGYYKTHAELFKGAPNGKYDRDAWKGAYDWTGPETLTIGGVEYTQKRIVELYNMAPKGNQAIALFHQLATAKLNLEKTNASTPHSATAAAIAAADAWFAANPGWQTGVFATPLDTSWIGILDAFNNGADSAHCD